MSKSQTNKLEKINILQKEIQEDAYKDDMEDPKFSQESESKSPSSEIKRKRAVIAKLYMKRDEEILDATRSNRKIFKELRSWGDCKIEERTPGSTATKKVKQQMIQSLKEKQIRSYSDQRRIDQMQRDYFIKDEQVKRGIFVLNQTSTASNLQRRQLPVFLDNQRKPEFASLDQISNQKDNIFVRSQQNNDLEKNNYQFQYQSLRKSVKKLNFEEKIHQIPIIIKNNQQQLQVNNVPKMFFEDIREQQIKNFDYKQDQKLINDQQQKTQNHTQYNQVRIKSLNNEQINELTFEKRNPQLDRSDQFVHTPSNQSQRNIRISFIHSEKSQNEQIQQPFIDDQKQSKSQNSYNQNDMKSKTGIINIQKINSQLISYKPESQSRTVQYSSKESINQNKENTDLDKVKNKLKSQNDNEGKKKKKNQNVQKQLRLTNDQLNEINNIYISQIEKKIDETYQQRIDQLSEEFRMQSEGNTQKQNQISSGNSNISNYRQQRNLLVEKLQKQESFHQKERQQLFLQRQIEMDQFVQTKQQLYDLQKRIQKLKKRNKKQEKEQKQIDFLINQDFHKWTNSFARKSIFWDQNTNKMINNQKSSSCCIPGQLKRISPEKFAYEDLKHMLKKIEDLISDPRSEYRGSNDKIHNLENYLKYNKEDWIKPLERVRTQQKPYLQLQKYIQKLPVQGQYIIKGKKFSQNNFGNIQQNEVLQQISDDILKKQNKQKNHDIKLIFKGKEITLDDFLRQINQGVIEPIGQRKKKFVHRLS